MLNGTGRQLGSRSSSGDAFFEADTVGPIFSDLDKAHLLVEMTCATVPGRRSQSPFLGQRELFPQELKGLCADALVLKVRIYEDPTQLIMSSPFAKDDDPADDLIGGQYLVVLAHSHHPPLPMFRIVSGRSPYPWSPTVYIAVKRAF